MESRFVFEMSVYLFITFGLFACSWHLIVPVSFYSSILPGPYILQWLDYLSSLKENSKFNLANMIKLAKDVFGIKYFFCWHAIAGYWFGLDLDSQELRRYSISILVCA